LKTVVLISTSTSTHNVSLTIVSFEISLKETELETKTLSFGCKTDEVLQKINFPHYYQANISVCISFERENQNLPLSIFDQN
jgi:hypothetical protein